VVAELGPDVPMHFSAFHPDYKLNDRPRTPPPTLNQARRIAQANGVRFAYTGNVHDRDGDRTDCPGCGAAVIERDWYTLLAWRLDGSGACRACGAEIPGVFEAAPGDWGSKRRRLQLAGF
jgi:pyruvate formate lyase activating enzyme